MKNGRIIYFYFVDITEIFPDLSSRLQGKDQLCSSIFKRITSFTKKLELTAQLKGGNIVHIRSLSVIEKKIL